MTPIILLCGESGSGKDTIAGFLAKNHQAQPIAFADPFKRFAMNAFGFSENQLWGPSEARNHIDTKFADHDVCNEVLERVDGQPGQLFLHEMMLTAPYHADLKSWAFKLLKDVQQQRGLSARKMLQLIGSEWGRHIDKSMWVTRAMRVATDLLYYGGDYSRTKGYTSSSTPAPNFVCISDGRFRNEILYMREVGAQVWKVRSTINQNTAVAGVANHVSEAEQKTIPDFYFTHIIDNDKASGLDALEQTVKSAVTRITDYTLKPEWLSTKLAATRGW